MDIQVSDLALIQDDDQMSTSLLVSVKDLLLFFVVVGTFPWYMAVFTLNSHIRGGSLQTFIFRITSGTSTSVQTDLLVLQNISFVSCIHQHHQMFISETM